MAKINKRAVFTQAIEGTASIMSEEIILNPVVVGKASVFDPLRIFVREGIQKKHTLPIYARKGQIAKPYYKGMEPVSAGAFIASEMQVHLSAAFVRVNIQDFDDVIIGNENILGTNKEPKRIPFAETILWGISESFTEDLLEAIVFGEYDPKGEAGYPNYDGIATLVKQAIESKEISKTAGNLIESSGFPEPVDAEDTTAWDNFEAVLKKLNPALLTAPELIAETSTVTQGNILSAYYNKFKHTLTEESVKMGNFFLTYPNVKLVGHAIYGKGDAVLFTVPNNLEVGVDSISDDEFCDVTPNPFDKNEFTIQIQSRFGMRINNKSPKKFAVTDGDFIPNDMPLSGDMMPTTVNAETSDETYGTVVVSPEKETYDLGEEITLTATPTAEGEFLIWDDHIIEPSRKVKAEGLPIGLKAFFRKKKTTRSLQPGGEGEGENPKEGDLG